ASFEAITRHNTATTVATPVGHSLVTAFRTLGRRLEVGCNRDSRNYASILDRFRRSKTMALTKLLTLQIHCLPQCYCSIQLLFNQRWRHLARVRQRGKYFAFE